MRVALWGLGLLAAWGVLLTLLLATGAWPAGVWPARAPNEPYVFAPHPALPDPGANAPKAAAPEPEHAAAPAPGSAEKPSPIVAARFSVCPREEAPPALSQVRLGDKHRELWALHCGSSAHLIAIEEAAGTLLPRRVLSASLRSHNAAEAPHAVRIGAADIDGDERPDLLLPVLFTDRSGAPAAGALAWLRQRAQGGFDPPGRALDVAVGDVTPAKLDAQAGQDLALLQLQDARAARTSELWLVRGGPAPLRYARLPAGVGPSAVAAADLDRDGLDDVAVVSEREQRVRIWLSSRSAGAGPAAAAEPIALELEGVREAFAGDVDGDGARDLVLTGKRVWLVVARADFRAEPLPVASSEGLRDVQLEDANADGKLDLIGYAHPTVVALEQATSLAFTRRSLATLRGDFGVLFARAAQLDADGQPDLVLLSVGNTAGAQLELAIAPNVRDGVEIELADDVDALRDTALIERFSLP